MHCARVVMEFVNAVARLTPRKQLVKKLTHSDVEKWGLKGVELRSHQLEGVSWLVERCDVSQGCILGDEMGLGKTLQARDQLSVFSVLYLTLLLLQAVAMLLYIKHSRKDVGPFLIVCPLSVVGGWEMEIQRYCHCSIGSCTSSSH